MLKNILVVLNNGVQFEVLNVVEYSSDGTFTTIKEKSGQEQHINNNSLAFMSVKSSIETTPTIEL